MGPPRRERQPNHWRRARARSTENKQVEPQRSKKKKMWSAFEAENLCSHKATTCGPKTWLSCLDKFVVLSLSSSFRISRSLTIPIDVATKTSGFHIAMYSGRVATLPHLSPFRQGALCRREVPNLHRQDDKRLAEFGGVENPWSVAAKCHWLRTIINLHCCCCYWWVLIDVDWLDHGGSHKKSTNCRTATAATYWGEDSTDDLPSYCNMHRLEQWQRFKKYVELDGVGQSGG